MPRGRSWLLHWSTVHRASPRLTAAIVAAGAALIASIGPPAPATAADKLLLGGGAGITLNDDTLCTLTAMGHDSTGRLIGFTAAHCGGPGSPVVAEGAEDHGTVGTVVAADEELDYAVVEFDPAKVKPIADYEGFGIYGLGPAEPEPAGPEPGQAPAGTEPAVQEPASQEPYPEPSEPDVATAHSTPVPLTSTSHTEPL